MPDVEIRFEREGVEGIVPVGTTLVSAARRFGIRFDDCVPAKHLHKCSLVVSSGTAILSPMTETETEHFAAAGRRSNERLACEARITKGGEIVIMTDQKSEEPKTTQTKDRVQDEFSSLPLDKKFASLLQMEVATLSETFTYVANSSLKVLEKFGDAITDFGSKIETEAKKAANATEPAQAASAPKAKTAPPKAASKRKPSPPRAPKA